MTDNHNNNTMQNDNQSTEGKDSQQTTSESPSCDAACSRSYDDLIESLDSWIDDALKNAKPIGLTLCRARVAIKEQRARIGGIFDALECKNKEVYRLREQVKRLRGALNMWRMEGPDSNACWCDACLAMHGAHPAHSEECTAARDAIDSSDNAEHIHPDLTPNDNE